VDSQLTTNKNIDIIFLHSEVRAPAVITVLQAHNLKAGDITLVGTDGTPTGLAAIRDGWMLETVQQPVPQQVAGIWQYMSDVLAKKTFSPGSVDIGGLTSELTLESWGPTLTLPGGVIDATNVNDPSLWGNLKVIVGS
jgi:ABC-type sugar transport system substrate-binding protein